MKKPVKRGPKAIDVDAGSSSQLADRADEKAEKRATTEAFARSEQKFANIVLNFLDVVLIIEVDTGEIIFANKALVTVLGYEVEDVVGKHFSMIQQPESVSTAYEDADQFSVHGAVFPAQQILRADGSAIPMDLTATLIPWDDRTVVLATFRDVSDRESALRALRVSELRYRTLFDQASDAIMLENDERHILDVNRAACHMTGYSRDNLMTMRTTDLRPASETGVQDLSETTLDMESPFETLVVRSDGAHIPVELTVAPLVTEGTRSFLTITRDITERKRAEEDLRRAHDELEKAGPGANRGAEGLDGQVVEGDCGTHGSRKASQRVTGRKRGPPSGDSPSSEKQPSDHFEPHRATESSD